MIIYISREDYTLRTNPTSLKRSPMKAMVLKQYGDDAKFHPADLPEPSL